MRVLSLSIVLLVAALSGCKKSEASPSTPDSKPASTSAAKPTSAPAKPASTSEATAWVKAKGAEDVPGAPGPIQVPKGYSQKKNEHGWSVSTGPMYFYKASEDEVRASMMHLLDKGGWSCSEKAVGSIKSHECERSGARVVVSVVEQMTTKLVFISMRKGM